METDRTSICGCKGIRTCLKCEQIFNIANTKNDLNTYQKDWAPYTYCDECDKCWPGWTPQDHNNHSGNPIAVGGIYVQKCFLSDSEEVELVNALDSLPWDVSQSGRRKQNYGPKCNFKKMKLRLGDFKGFPTATKFVQDKFKSVPLLRGFQTIEQCSLEYEPSRGSCIDPHIDDCWIWGDRIVSVNLLSDTTLTLTKFIRDKDIDRYNLSLAPVVSISAPEMALIRIPHPARSLVVLHDEARYGWEHQIFRNDITERRICLAYREFTPPYIPGGARQEEGQLILDVASNWI